MDKKIFNEETLGNAIKKQWGEYGAHYELYKSILKSYASNRAEKDLPSEPIEKVKEIFKGNPYQKQIVRVFTELLQDLPTNVLSEEEINKKFYFITEPKDTRELNFNDRQYGKREAAKWALSKVKYQESVSDEEIKRHFDYAPLEYKGKLVEGAIWYRDRDKTQGDQDKKEEGVCECDFDTTGFQSKENECGFCNKPLRGV